MPETFEGEHDFLPSAARGKFLDGRVHGELAASFGHLAEITEEVAPELSRRLASLQGDLAARRLVRPLAFRQYYLLVQALSENDLESVETHLKAIEDLPPRPPVRGFTYFGHPDGDALSLELISDGMRIAPIEGKQAFDFCELIRAAFDLMRSALPGMYAELDAIVREILLARAPKGDRVQFDGASHYQFWGLLMINPSYHKTPLEVLEVLVHEASHSLLFGMTIDEPLVFNPDEELYKSPLRTDPRPMDGIFHATYVSARMYWAMKTLAESGLLSDTDQGQAKKAAQQDLENYRAGLDVVKAHGDLSRTGRRILEKVAEHI